MELLLSGSPSPPMGPGSPPNPDPSSRRHCSSPARSFRSNHVQLSAPDCRAVVTPEGVGQHMLSVKLERHEETWAGSGPRADSKRGPFGDGRERCRCQRSTTDPPAPGRLAENPAEHQGTPIITGAAGQGPRWRRTWGAPHICSSLLITGSPKVYSYPGPPHTVCPKEEL